MQKETDTETEKLFTYIVCTMISRGIAGLPRQARQTRFGPCLKETIS